MLCYYCGARLQWVDARMITITHPIAERGDKAVAQRRADNQT